MSSTSALYSTEDDPLVDLKNFGLGRLLLILCNQVEFWMVNMTYNRVSNGLSDELLCGTKFLHEFNYADRRLVVICEFNMYPIVKDRFFKLGINFLRFLDHRLFLKYTIFTITITSCP